MPKSSPLEIIKQQVKIEYQTTPAKSKELSLRYNIKDSTIRSWICRFKWRKANKDITEEVEKILDIPEEDQLTEMEQLFCIFYTRDPIGASAARRAGFSGRSAYEIAYQLMQKPAIRKEIKRLKKIKFKSIMLQPDDVVEKYMRIAFTPITDFLEFGRIEVPIMGPFGPVQIEDPDTKEKKTLTRMVNDVRFKESSEIDGGIISEVKVGRDGASIKLHDPQKALEWLDKYFELNPMDKHKKAYDMKRLELAQKEYELKEKESKSKDW
jgi:phage terminase small subunit